MPSRLKVSPLPTWSDKSRDNPQGPPTYIRHASANPGALQVSWASYTAAGAPPRMTDDGLIQLAMRLATGSGAQFVSRHNGNSSWGRFGCVVATTPQHRMQIWVINSGPESVLVTHTGPNPPDEVEILEAEQIAMGILVTDAEDRPTKKPSLWQRLRGGG